MPPSGASWTTRCARQRAAARTAAAGAASAATMVRRAWELSTVAAAAKGWPAPASGHWGVELQRQHGLFRAAPLPCSPLPAPNPLHPTPIQPLVLQATQMMTSARCSIPSIPCLAGGRAAAVAALAAAAAPAAMATAATAPAPMAPMAATEEVSEAQAAAVVAAHTRAALAFTDPPGQRVHLRSGTLQLGSGMPGTAAALLAKFVLGGATPSLASFTEYPAPYLMCCPTACAAVLSCELFVEILPPCDTRGSPCSSWQQVHGSHNSGAATPQVLESLALQVMPSTV